MLGQRFAFRAFDVANAELPERMDDCDGYVITGSAAGVHDGHQWILALQDFLRAVRGGTKLVGICFGHQIMANAFGGAVERSPRGWGLGLHHYAVSEVASWMDPVRSIAVPVSHQDQVVTLPPGARVLAGSGFTPYGMLAYDDGRSISLQCHPEFEPCFAAQMTLAHGKRQLSPVELERAVAAFAQPNDCARVGNWVASFLQADASSATVSKVDGANSRCTMPALAEVRDIGPLGS